MAETSVVIDVPLAAPVDQVAQLLWSKSDVQFDLNDGVLTLLFSVGDTGQDPPEQEERPSSSSGSSSPAVEDSASETQRVAESSPSFQRPDETILEILFEDQSIWTTDELVEESGYGKPVTRRALNQLVRTGAVTRSKDGSDTYFQITDATLLSVPERTSLIYREVLADKALTTKQVADALGQPLDVALNHLDSLHAAGTIKRVNQGWTLNKDGAQ